MKSNYNLICTNETPPSKILNNSAHSPIQNVEFLRNEEGEGEGLQPISLAILEIY